MPKLFKTKRLDTGDLTSGSSWTKEFNSPTAGFIHRIFIHPTDGTNLPNTLVSLRIGGDIKFLDDICALTLGNDNLTAMVLDFEVKDQELIEITVKNQEGATKRYYITFEFYVP